MQLQAWLEKLENSQILEEKDVQLLCMKAIEILCEVTHNLQESNVQPVTSPVTVCGDIHGQFYDLLELFRIGGKMPDQKYIFIGDFVDRGYHSVETLEYLLILKVLYPDLIVLLRGNHETRQITSTYGFYDEILKKYGNANCWHFFTELFGTYQILDYLPIAALIEGSVLCIHGGLSPEIKTIDQLRLIDRVQEIPVSGAFCDIMWSDPDDIAYWNVNPRGAGWIYGGKVVKKFNQINNLELICRAHQLVNEGYKYWFLDKNLITVWSCPNYFYRCGNVASMLNFDDKMQRKIQIFNSVPQSQDSVPTKNILPYFL